MWKDTCLDICHLILIQKLFNLIRLFPLHVAPHLPSPAPPSCPAESPPSDSCSHRAGLCTTHTCSTSLKGCPYCPRHTPCSLYGHCIVSHWLVTTHHPMSHLACSLHGLLIPPRLYQSVARVLTSQPGLDKYQHRLSSLGGLPKSKCMLGISQL